MAIMSTASLVWIGSFWDPQLSGFSSDMGAWGQAPFVTVEQDERAPRGVQAATVYEQASVTGASRKGADRE